MDWIFGDRCVQAFIASRCPNEIARFRGLSTFAGFMFGSYLASRQLTSFIFNTRPFEFDPKDPTMLIFILSPLFSLYSWSVASKVHLFGCLKLKPKLLFSAVLTWMPSGHVISMGMFFVFIGSLVSPLGSAYSTVKIAFSGFIAAYSLILKFLVTSSRRAIEYSSEYCWRR